MKGLSCSFLISSTKKTPYCLPGYAIMSGNLAKGFMILTDTVHHVRPFFLWDGIVRITWTRMLLHGDDLGKTAKYLLEGEESLIEPAVWGEKVD
jgi:hypothetical protein